MKIAVMQPYFYPYLGYFELINSVDHFVFLSDVQYTKGWINRNKIRSNEKSWQYIGIPLEKSPQKTLICDMKIHGNWIDDFCKKLIHTYGKKAIFHPIYQNIQTFKGETTLCNVLIQSTMFVSNYLGLNTVFSDSRKYDCKLKKQDKLICITKSLGGKIYVNLPGGVELYKNEDFEVQGIHLEFQKPCQHYNKLSILDLCLGEGLDRLS